MSDTLKAETPTERPDFFGTQRQASQSLQARPLSGSPSQPSNGSCLCASANRGAALRIESYEFPFDIAVGEAGSQVHFGPTTLKRCN